MRVLIVEDESDMAEALAVSLRFQWPDCVIDTAPDGTAALGRVRSSEPDLILLDLGLPGLDGLAVLRELRRTLAVPVIVITARGAEMDKVRGLEMGADDYLAKPFGHLELLARVKAVLRRGEMPPIGVDPASSYYDGYLGVDFARREVTVEGSPVRLTRIEYNLLATLIKNAGHIVPYRLLLTKVWGPEYDEEIDYLRVYARRLREKIEPRPEEPRYIVTERGIGYRFVHRPAPPDGEPQHTARREHPMGYLAP